MWRSTATMRYSATAQSRFDAGCFRAAKVERPVPSQAVLSRAEGARKSAVLPVAQRRGTTRTPSARLLQVGGREYLLGDEFAHRPATPGCTPAGGRTVGVSFGRSEYPLAAFHFAGDDAAEGFTLCFEDRDGQQGLHRFYDGQVRREASRERIILSLRLAPHEFEALCGALAPGTSSSRSVFASAGTVVRARSTPWDPAPSAGMDAARRCTSAVLPLQ